MLSRKKKNIILVLVMLPGAAVAAALIFFRPTFFPDTALFRPPVSPPALLDDLSRASLSEALEKNLVYLAALPETRTFTYGSEAIEVSRIVAAQRRLLEFLRREEPNPEQLAVFLHRHFTLLEVARQPAFFRPQALCPVLFTGYYVPTLRGRRQPDERFCFPLYRQPRDLVSVELSHFNLEREVENRWPWLRRLPFIPRLEELRFPRLRGRLTADGRVLPYHTRREIDQEGKLDAAELALVWVDDPIDRFFLHIQGSGRVELESGETIMVGYAGANGHPYRSIGAWLIRQGELVREAVTMPSIREWIRANPERRDEIFSSNPSYVFFRELPGGEPLGCFQTALTPGRSIALDRGVFPGGALAWVETELPVFADDGQAAGRKPCRRLVLNQDTGGAIRGSFRVDLYCGSDRQAEQTAGHLKDYGRLLLLLPLE